MYVNPELAECSPYREAVGEQLAVSPASKALGNNDTEALSDEAPPFDFRSICPWLVGGALVYFFLLTGDES